MALEEALQSWQQLCLVEEPTSQLAHLEGDHKAETSLFLVSESKDSAPAHRMLLLSEEEGRAGTLGSTLHELNKEAFKDDNLME